MSLTDSGRSALNPATGGTNYHATGATGETVVVEASREVIDDRGEEAVLLKVREKYDAGQVVNGKVIIRNSDFQ
jgi:hypothetical protein